MISLEKKYTLFSPATGGGEERVGELGVVISRLSAGESADSDVRGCRVSASACVRRECAPKCGFVRGMRLVRGKESYLVQSAVLCSRLWILRLERTVMEGEV